MLRSNPKILLSFIIFLMLIVSTSFAGKIIYVDADATGANNGSSWAYAYKCLQDALAAAQYGDEIWVAKGVYKPDQQAVLTRFGIVMTSSGDRNAAFQLQNGVAIYGGFPPGGGTWDERDPNDTNNETILSGDLEGNDVDVNHPYDLSNEPNRAENNYHVVIGSETDETAVLDGFTISGGNANGFDQADSGAGIYNNNGSPMITNCIFSRNSASLRGGGMFNANSSNPTLKNCTFSGNLAEDGGGMRNNDSSPKLNNCFFTSNFAEWCGGGMSNSSSNPTLSNCTFEGNESYAGGGGINNWESSPILPAVRSAQTQRVTVAAEWPAEAVVLRS